jgi:hypothetical protein
VKIGAWRVPTRFTDAVAGASRLGAMGMITLSG